MGVDLLEPEHPFEGCKYLKMNVVDLSEKELKGVDYIIHLACDTNIRNSIENNKFAKFLKEFYNSQNLEMPDGPL